jgi:hypothetical protein
MVENVPARPGFVDSLDQIHVAPFAVGPRDKTILR